MLMRFDPFWELASRELDRMSQMTTEQGGGLPQRTMPIDAYRHGDQLAIRVDLPGVDRDSIELTAEKNVLAVRAERTWKPEEGQDVVVAERPQETFSRHPFLGESLDIDRTTASYDQGVLTLVVPGGRAGKATQGRNRRGLRCKAGHQQVQLELDCGPSPSRSTRIPAVQRLVRPLTGGKDPNMTVNPAEVVAVGAATQAAIIKGEIKAVLLLDATPLSLGVETLGGMMTKVIERSTTIPVRRTEVFSTPEDNESAVDVIVLQGERERAADNRVLARFRLEGIGHAPRGEPQIEVAFDIDGNGILNVSARDKDTDAVQHRAEDARVRQEVDARNELDATACQVDRRLRELGDSVPTHEKAWAEMLVSDARQAVNDNAPLDRARALTQELRRSFTGWAFAGRRMNPRIAPAGRTAMTMSSTRISRVDE